MVERDNIHRERDKLVFEHDNVHLERDNKSAEHDKLVEQMPARRVRRAFRLIIPIVCRNHGRINLSKLAIVRYFSCFHWQFSCSRADLVAFGAELVAFNERFVALSYLLG